MNALLRASAGFLLVGCAVYLGISFLGIATDVISPPVNGNWGLSVIAIMGGPHLGALAGVVGAVLGGLDVRPRWLGPGLVSGAIVAEIASIALLWAILLT